MRLIYLLVGLLLMGCHTENVDPPNVILIMTDDQGYGDLGIHGNPFMRTTNLDAFAAASLELTNFHSGTTCAPTRAGLMTGRNANRNNAWHTIAGCSILLDDEETLPEVFVRNGYSTKMIGKWHLGDNYPYRPQDRGFEETFYHGGGGVQQTPDFWNNDYFDDTYFRNGVPEKTEGYCTDVWFDEAIDFVKNKKEKPFFMYLAPNAAHGPFNVPEAYAKLYEDMPLTPEQKRFYGMVTNIDDNFGRLVATLKEEGLFDNTIVIFTTDNGTARGITHIKETNTSLGYNAGLRGIKGSHYDGGHRVPFIISWPDGDILRKTSSNSLVSHVDMLPTLTDLSGIEYQPKKTLDGISVANIIRGEKKTNPRMLVVDTQRNQLPEKGRNSCVMSGTWRLIDGKELYDTANDHGQTNDLALAHPDRVAKMQNFYEQWWESTVPEFRYAEIPLGDEMANPVLITIHDMHTSDNLPWNQVQIREARMQPQGFYSVNVKSEGRYRIRLYRYPPEADLAIEASADILPGTSYLDPLPAGAEVQPVKASVFLDAQEMTVSVNPAQNFAELEGLLRPGSYKLKSYFTTEGGAFVPAFYTQFEKL